MGTHIVSVDSSTAKKNHNSNTPTNQFVHTVLKSAFTEETHIKDIKSIDVMEVTKKQDSTRQEVNEREIGAGKVRVKYTDTYEEDFENKLTYGIFVSPAEDEFNYTSVEVIIH